MGTITHTAADLHAELCVQSAEQFRITANVPEGRVAIETRMFGTALALVAMVAAAHPCKSRPIIEAGKDGTWTFFDYTALTDERRAEFQSDGSEKEADMAAVPKIYSQKSNAQRAALAGGFKTGEFELYETKGGWAFRLVGKAAKTVPAQSKRAAAVAVAAAEPVKAKAEAKPKKAAKPAKAAKPPKAAKQPKPAKVAKAKPEKPAKAAGEPRANSKQAELIAMLQRPNGASIAEAAEKFGWEQHTVRGAIAGALKKKLGLPVQSAKEEGRGTVYRLAA